MGAATWMRRKPESADRERHGVQGRDRDREEDGVMRRPGSVHYHSRPVHSSRPDMEVQLEGLHHHITNRKGKLLPHPQGAAGNPCQNVEVMLSSSNGDRCENWCVLLHNMCRSEQTLNFSVVFIILMSCS